LTSPETGDLFGAVVARAIDAEWERCGWPDPWIVIEAAAGSGALAAGVLAAGPACAAALRYVAVEVSAPLRSALALRLPVEVPAFVLGPGSPAPADSHEEDLPTATPGRGPLLTVLAELPAQPFTGMIIANELLDNLAFDLLERRDGVWWDVRVGESDGRAVELLVVAPEELAEEATRLVPAPVEGGRVALQSGARRWLSSALRLVQRGRVVCIDYCTPTTAAMAARPQPEWLRTYRSHGLGTDPLQDPGGQDITCEVAVDQLARVRFASLDRPQADWLVAHGIDELVDAARRVWDEAAGRPDLAALAARSRIAEGAALRDPAGFGAFRVLEWAAG
jgi:NADH dehydrogenase [ubiquinone] 1 alpha subcomplex assembly factor 7